MNQIKRYSVTLSMTLLILEPVVALAQNRVVEASRNLTSTRVSSRSIETSESFTERIGRKIHQVDSNRSEMSQLQSVAPQRLQQLAAFVEKVSSKFRNFMTLNDWLQVCVPENWQIFEDQNQIVLSSATGYRFYQGKPIFTQGSVLGIANLPTRSLRQASDQYISALIRNNHHLEIQQLYRYGRVGGSSSLTITLAGVAPQSGIQEFIVIHTALLQNGKLFYVMNVYQEGAIAQNQDEIFAAIINSIILKL